MNNEDFRALVALAREVGDDGSYLIEIGRRATGRGAGWRLFRSSTGTFIAGVSADGQRIRIGDTDERGSEVALTRRDLGALVAVDADWSGRRHTFWEFITRRHAFQPSHRYFLPPAGAGERTEVPDPWTGTEVESPLPMPRVIAAAAELAAEVIRTGESVAAGDVPVGAVYNAGDLRIIGRRASVEVQRAGSRLILGLDDVVVLGELLATVGRQTGERA